jgi:hypothetical protein
LAERRARDKHEPAPHGAGRVAVGRAGAPRPASAANDNRVPLRRVLRRAAYWAAVAAAAAFALWSNL